MNHEPHEIMINERVREIELYDVSMTSLDPLPRLLEAYASGLTR